MKEIISFQMADQLYWKRLRLSSQALSDMYLDMSPHTLFFDVLLKERFLQKCQNRYMMLKKEFPEKADIERWDSREIDKMFGKGLNHNSLITNYESISWLINDLSEINSIVEFGPGAGWSTVILWNTVKKCGLNPLIFSIDMSTHAISACTVLLDHYEIPWILIKNMDEYKYVIKNRQKYLGYVILQYEDFEKGLRIHDEDSIDVFYSAHGTAYLSESEYDLILRTIHQKGKSGGLFVTDSLDPTYSVELSKIGSLSRMLFPGMIKKFLNDKDNWYVYSGTKACGSIYYGPEQRVKIISNLNDPRSFVLYSWINKLIKRLDIKRIIEIKNSLELTAHIIEQYREDVYPSILIDKLLTKYELDSKFSIVDNENKPDWPPFMCTVKLRIEK